MWKAHHRLLHRPANSSREFGKVPEREVPSQLNPFFTSKIERIRLKLVLRKSGLVHSPGLAKPTCFSRLSEFDLVTDEETS